MANSKYPLTNFPDAIDNYPQFLDMSQADFSLVRQYQDALERQDFVTARSVFAQIPNGTQKVVTALRLNQLQEATLAIEEFYKTDVKPYIDTKQNEWETYADRFNYKGDWSSTKSYDKNNIVKFNDNGLIQLYLNVLDTPINTPPTNTTYWRVLTVQGLRGEAGEGANFAFEWNGAIDYNTDTIVVFDNTWWNALKPSRNEQPFVGSEFWQVVLKVTQAIYPLTPNQPISQSEGELWFKDKGVI